MTSIGETLREERLRRHLDIHAISEELKISTRFLEAIEKEQFNQLPAPVFAKSFVRQYARILGLPEDDLADAVGRLMEPPPEPAERPAEKAQQAIQLGPMAEWERVGERRSWSSTLPALALVVVVMLGCSGVYAWWQRTRHSASAHEPARSEAVGEPAAQAHDAPAGSAARPAAPAPPVAESHAPPRSPEAAPDRAAIEPVSTASRVESPAESADPGAAAAAAAEPLKPAGPVHVEITASEQVWVSAKADGKTSFIGTMEAHQSHTVDANGTVVLRLGNAGGAQITLNGKDIGQVGPRGQPRTIQLTSGGFQIVASPKPDLLFDPLR